MKEELEKTKTFMINYKIFKTIFVKIIKYDLKRPENYSRKLFGILNFLIYLNNFLKNKLCLSPSDMRKWEILPGSLGISSTSI
jgi:hypothetical protein